MFAIRNSLNQMKSARRLAMQLRKSHDHGHHEVPHQYRQPTMAEFPVPRGSWRAKYEEVQQKNNKVLIAAVILFISSGWYWTRVADFVLQPPKESITKLE